MLSDDIFQLKPPKNGQFIFEMPKNSKYKLLYESDDLWSSFDVAILYENHRQGENNFWTNMLNRFRIGEVLEEDKKLLDSRRLNNFPNLDTNAARHAFYSNREVNQHNDKILSSIDSKLFEAQSITSFPKRYTPQIVHGMYKDTQLMVILQFKIKDVPLKLNSTRKYV